MNAREEIRFMVIRSAAKNLIQIAKNIKAGTILSGNYWPRVYADQVHCQADIILKDVEDLLKICDKTHSNL